MEFDGTGGGSALLDIENTYDPDLHVDQDLIQGGDVAGVDDDVYVSMEDLAEAMGLDRDPAVEEQSGNDSDDCPPTPPAIEAASCDEYTQALNAAGDAVDAPLPSFEPSLEDLLVGSQWGVFRFTARHAGTLQGGVYGGWQVNCPFHKKSVSATGYSGCRRFFSCLGVTSAARQVCLRKAFWWAVKSSDYSRQRHHLPCPLGDLPSARFLQARIIVERPPPGSVLPDEELDADPAEAGIADALVLVEKDVAEPEAVVEEVAPVVEPVPEVVGPVMVPDMPEGGPLLVARGAGYYLARGRGHARARGRARGRGKGARG